MSYTPTTWAAGDTVTAAKLNKLEQGVASSGGGLKVGVTTIDGGTNTIYALDKTWKQISDAIENGIIPYEITDEKYVNILSRVYTYENPGGTVYAVAFGQNDPYETSSENSYPSYISSVTSK